MLCVFCFEIFKLSLHQCRQDCNKTNFNYTVIHAQFLEDKAALNKVKQSVPLAIPPTGGRYLSLKYKTYYVFLRQKY